MLRCLRRCCSTAFCLCNSFILPMLDRYVGMPILLSFSTIIAQHLYLLHFLLSQFEPFYHHTYRVNCRSCFPKFIRLVRRTTLCLPCKSGKRIGLYEEHLTVYWVSELALCFTFSTPVLKTIVFCSLDYSLLLLLSIEPI